LRKSIVKMIKHEKNTALDGKPARIIAKLNALTDPAVIKELYEASSAGVQIDLIVRGVCCLKPKIPRVSENIRVISVVGRFLEHSRVYYFLNANHPLYCSSADWMERSFSNRIEVCFPVLGKKLANRIIKELEIHINTKDQSWELQANGEYKELTFGTKEPDAQNVLLNQLAQI